MNRGRVAADAEPAQQQRQASRRLTATEYHWIPCDFIVEQAPCIEVARSGDRPKATRLMLGDHSRAELE